MKNANHAPAFPGQRFTNNSDRNLTAPNGQVVAPGDWVELPGMALRDYFAAKALQAIIQSDGPNGNTEYDKTDARRAFMYADAMIKAREE